MKKIIWLAGLVAALLLLAASLAYAQESQEEAVAALAERKLVERAKGIVMNQRGLNEDEAFRFLRKTAMDRNFRLSEIAQQIIDAADLLGQGTGADVVALDRGEQNLPGPLTAAASGFQPESDGQWRPEGSDG